MSSTDACFPRSFCFRGRYHEGLLRPVLTALTSVCVFRVCVGVWTAVLAVLAVSRCVRRTNDRSTSISNTKKVPVTCVLVDALPRSTDDIIKARKSPVRVCAT